MEILKDKEACEVYSLKRSIAFFGTIILSGGFIIAAYKGTVDWKSFLAYPMGLVILYFPELAMRMLKIWKGG